MTAISKQSFNGRSTGRVCSRATHLSTLPNSGKYFYWSEISIGSSSKLFPTTPPSTLILPIWSSKFWASNVKATSFLKIQMLFPWSNFANSISSGHWLFHFKLRAHLHFWRISHQKWWSSCARLTSQRAEIIQRLQLHLSLTSQVSCQLKRAKMELQKICRKCLIFLMINR